MKMEAFGDKILIDGEKVICIPRVNPTTGNEQFRPLETHRVAAQIAAMCKAVDVAEKLLEQWEHGNLSKAVQELAAAVKLAKGK